MGQTPAALLRSARHAAGLSRTALAHRAGVPTSTVSRIEEGLSDPTCGTLGRLLAAAGCTLVLDAPPDPAAIPTVASLATASTETDGRSRIDWTRLRAFSDWVHHHPDHLAEAVADPPARTGTPLDAILAALTEALAAEHDLPAPAWTRAVGPIPGGWTPPGTPAMVARAALSTPQPFRRRHIILPRDALLRAA